MPIQIMMPALSPTMEKGKLLKWLVAEGQMVNPGDAVAEIETEKATVEVEAVDQGKVAKLLVPEGTEGVKVNTPIALLEGGTPGATLKTHVRARAESVKMTTAASPVHTAPRPMSGSLADTALGAGAVIGRSRLVGDHGPPLARTTDLAPGEPGGQPKTQYIRTGAIDADPVAGWLVVVKGPGRGGYRPIFVGMNSVGRDAGQRISLNWGDDMISREEHAFIAYDEEARRFYLQHGGKANLVRLGGQPVLSPTELQAFDLIRIGKTTLRFIPLCGPEFAWSDEFGDG
ncbi:MAG: FHA domain-containing protein [Hyphomicrobiaceae bacterium]|nr:FHA domain-containing protein [Hyphomicrobiaceae bacterium]